MACREVTRSVCFMGKFILSQFKKIKNASPDCALARRRWLYSISMLAIRKSSAVRRFLSFLAAAIFSRHGR